MISITINGRKIELEGPVTILEAARKNGIEIPTLCSHPALELWGGCRMCLVEIEKMPRLQTSCTVTAADGMTVYTETPRVVAARKAMLEFLLINHPLQCPTCDKAGECALQDLTVRYGAVAGRFEEGKRTFPENVDDPIIVRNMERCIMCTRCVRMCDSVQGASAIGVVGRGARSHVEPFSGGRYNCEYCGNCLNVCPVGAIMSRLHRYTYRPWQMDKAVKTVCSFCGVGCTMLLEVRGDAIQKVSPAFGKGVNNGLLCGRGMFGYGYVGSPERLKTPLVRKNGKLEPASWDEALAFAASRLLEIKNRHGGGAIGGMAGSRCTNEDNYVFQKFLRAGFGSNNIDSVARLGLLHAQGLLEGLFGQGAAANVITGIAGSDAVLTVACDPTQTNPVMGLQVRAAAKAGRKVVTIGHARGLRRHRTHSLPTVFGAEGVALAGLLKELLRMKKDSLPGENLELEAAIKEFKLPEPEETERLTGVPRAAISDAAAALKDVSTSSIIAGRELAASMDARRNFMLLAAIGYIINARFFLISERPNEQGLIDMGCAPDLLPGGRPVSLHTFRESYEREWGVRLNPEPGLTLMEMFEQAGDAVRAMYIMGENPAFNLPGGKKIMEALEKLDFLVVQDIFMTETASLADVVLPSRAWPEKEGTYTNLEKRIQKLDRALEKNGETAKEDWKILAGIGKRAGLNNMPYAASSDIIDELARVSPLHAGLGLKDLEQEGMMWPYKGKPLGMGGHVPPLPPMRAMTKPKTKDAQMPGPGPAVEITGVVLEIEKPLFHSGTLSRHSGALLDIVGGPEAKMSPETGKKLGITEGGKVKISTADGEMVLKAKIEKGLPAGVVFAGNNFREAGALGLFGYELEPESKTPVPMVKDLEITPL